MLTAQRTGRVWCFQGGAERSLAPDELSAALELDTEPLWIDIDSTDPDQHAVLGTVFRIHPLAIEDTLDPRARVKVEDYDGKYLFIVLRAMRFEPDKPPEPERHGVKKLYLFLGRNYLVSVHAGPSSSVSEAAARLRRNGSLLGAGGPAQVAHLIGDVVVDAYFPILNRVDDFVDKLEHCDLAECDQTTLEQILHVRRLAFAAYRSLQPQREIFDVLAHREHALVSHDAQLYFRDVYDHALRITDSLDAYRELMSETTDSFLAQTSMRLGNATKVFSAIATIAIPFLVISALYSMNFAAVPLENNRFGFWIVLGMQAAISLAILAFLRWRKWL